MIATALILVTFESGLSPSLVASSTPVADVALSSELKKVKGRAWVYFYFSATADLNKHICQFPHCHRTYIAQTTSTLIERRHSTAYSTISDYLVRVDSSLMQDSRRA